MYYYSMRKTSSLSVLGKLITSIALFLAVAPMPSEYYMPLRILVFIAALTFTVYEWDDDFNYWIMSFLICGILFNPLFPIYFYEKQYWVPINILSGVLFFSSALKEFKNQKRQRRKKL